MKESEFIYDKINLSDINESDCEPLYDDYLEEIKHLIKDEIESKNKLASIENSNNDHVLLDNIVLNFDHVNEDKSSFVSSNITNLENYKASEDNFNNNLQKDQENAAEAIIPADNFGTQQDTYCVINTIDVLQNDPQDIKLFSEYLPKDTNNFIDNEEVPQSQLDPNKESIDHKIQSDINSNYIHLENSNSSKKSDCYNSGDIVIIDSNPRVLSEFEYVNKSEMVNDFDMINTFSSQSPNSNNENKSPYENFEVVGNDEVESQACNEEIRAEKRLFKENLERAERIKELSEDEHNQKLSIRENAREYINSFHK